jgi:predicted PurR-regulated permease PerM
MDMTLTLKDAGLILIGAGLFILICYGISLMRNLIVTVRHTNKILEDAQVITKLASERSKDVAKIIVDVASSASSISKNIKGNQSTVAALTSIVNSITSFKKLMKKSDEK